jgi:hypothetical protein
MSTLKILKPNLTSATNYSFEAKRLSSSSGVADAGAALYAATSANNSIDSISIDTVDADIVHTIVFRRLSDKKKMHECSFKHSKVATKKTKLLTVNFTTVPGNKIKTMETSQQTHEFVTYSCQIGESALPTATQIELSVSGGHGADPGTMNVLMSNGQNIGITFSGNGQVEWEFPVQMATVTVDPQIAAQQRVHDAWTLVYAGLQPYPTSVLDQWDAYGSQIGVSLGIGAVLDLVLNAGGFADLFGTDANVIAAGMTATSLYADCCVAALGATAGAAQIAAHPYASTSTDPICSYTGTPLTPGLFSVALSAAGTCF